MKEVWQRYAERIDALSLRERAYIFAALACVVCAFLYSFMIETDFARSRQLSNEIVQRQAEMKALREQVASLGRMRDTDPDRANREQLARVRAELADLNARVLTEERKFTAPAKMRGVVEELLARNKKVQLLDLRTLPVASIAEPKADAAAKGGGGAPERLIFRHGLELTISGGYLDLLAYLADLERLPTQLYWSSLGVDGSQYPVVTLKLTVYTLSLDRAWMSV